MINELSKYISDFLLNDDWDIAVYYNERNDKYYIRIGYEMEFDPINMLTPDNNTFNRLNHVMEETNRFKEEKKKVDVLNDKINKLEEKNTVYNEIFNLIEKLQDMKED